MNGFDVFVLVIILFCLIRGYFMGLIREVSGIIGIIVGFYGANTYYHTLTPYLEPLIDSSELRSLICFVVLFCCILALIGLLSALIHKLLSLVFLGWVDRLFGSIFGAAKGILIVSVLFIMMMAVLPANTGFLSGSKTVPYVAKVSSSMTRFFSKNTGIDFSKYLEGIKADWKK
ncbi:MAG: CvpA family protein [Desulfobacteraceae bacterium]|nr:CvpA family protein [Desulfobacteraceae bacterium]